MPTYEFECKKCKKKFSLVLSLGEYEHKKPKCPKCESKQVKQLIQSFFVVTSKKS